MSARTILAWTLALGASLAALGYSATRAAAARTSAIQAHARLTRATHDAQRLADLNARIAAASGPRKPASGLAPRIGAVLTRCGLPASCLTSLSPEGEQPVSSHEGQPRLKRQRATLVLGGLTLPQLGAFLDAWRRAEPEWTISTLDVGPQAGNPQAPAGGDLPLRATLTLESVFQDAEPPTASTHPFVGATR